jgi:hypothetical protein
MSGKFVAQSLAQTGISGDRRRFEMTFVDADGSKHTVTLPVGVAADLVPVLSSLAADAGGPSRAQFTKIPKQWAVGAAERERLVLIRFDDDPPYGLDLKVAETLWREMRQETENVSLLKAPALQ